MNLHLIFISSHLITFICKALKSNAFHIVSAQSNERTMSIFGEHRGLHFDQWLVSGLIMNMKQRVTGSHKWVHISTLPWVGTISMHERQTHSQVDKQFFSLLVFFLILTFNPALKLDKSSWECSTLAVASSLSQQDGSPFSPSSTPASPPFP